MRLSLSVVFSSIAGYLLGTQHVEVYTLILLAFGGYFMVGASNAYNQIIEKDLDALMDRTKNRPIPAGRMSVNTAFTIAVIFTILGIATLYVINPRTAMYGAISIFLYTCVYTPLKTKTPSSPTETPIFPPAPTSIYTLSDSLVVVIVTLSKFCATVKFAILNAIVTNKNLRYFISNSFFYKVL